MDGRSNQRCSVFAIKAQIEGESRGRIPQPSWQGQSIHWTLQHGSLGSAQPVPSASPPTTLIHPSQQGHVSQAALICKDLQLFGSCCTREHFPLHPRRAHKEQQRFRRRGRRALEGSACQCSTVSASEGLLQAQSWPSPAYLMGSTNIPAPSSTTSGFSVS